jgi:hypothetical protein
VNLQIVEREGQLTGAADVVWLRQPFRTTYHAMEELERALGESGESEYSWYSSGANAAWRSSKQRRSELKSGPSFRSADDSASDPIGDGRDRQ